MFRQCASGTLSKTFTKAEGSWWTSRFMQLTSTGSRSRVANTFAPSKSTIRVFTDWLFLKGILFSRSESLKEATGFSLRLPSRKLSICFERNDGRLAPASRCSAQLSISPNLMLLAIYLSSMQYRNPWGSFGGWEAQMLLCASLFQASRSGRLLLRTLSWSSSRRHCRRSRQKRLGGTAAGIHLVHLGTPTSPTHHACVLRSGAGRYMSSLWRHHHWEVTSASARRPPYW